MSCYLQHFTFPLEDTTLRHGHEQEHWYRLHHSLLINVSLVIRSLSVCLHLSILTVDLLSVKYVHYLVVINLKEYMSVHHPPPVCPSAFRGVGSTTPIVAHRPSIPPLLR